MQYGLTVLLNKAQTIPLPDFALCPSNMYVRSRDSVLGITTGYMLDEPGVGVKNFIFSTLSRPALRFTQPPIQLIPGVKWPGHEADHSSPTSAEVKKMWIYTSIPIHFHGVVLNWLSTGTTSPLS
jgi:hypothetical protein